ncbi:MAG: hypothetical protein FWG87_12600 [Defluviitaleaceae bacterium]|nr:hypothetical protein [Defluviitaleaceae bacterium]
MGKSTKIRHTRKNPRNRRKSVKSAFNALEIRVCMVFVGDGFIRPEITSFCVNGRYPSRIGERAYLGTDKSVPYKNLQIPSIIAIFQSPFLSCCATFPLCLCASV